jgi:hypothetical protein
VRTRLIYGPSTVALDIAHTLDPCLPCICRAAAFTCHKVVLNNEGTAYEDYSNLEGASQSHSSITDVRSRLTDIDPVCSGRTQWRLRAARPPQRLLSWEPVVKVLPWRCRPVKPLASDLHGRAGIQSPDQPTQTANFEPSLTISRQHRNVGMHTHVVSACRVRNRFGFETMQLSKQNLRAFGPAFPRNPGNAGQPKASPEECIQRPRLSISNPANLPPRPLLIFRCMLLLSASRNRHRMRVYVRSL